MCFLSMTFDSIYSNMNVEDITMDPGANWKVVERSKDNGGEEEGNGQSNIIVYYYGHHYWNSLKTNKL